jgi:hypothetical protein
MSNQVSEIVVDEVVPEHVFAPHVPDCDDAPLICGEDGVILHLGDEIAIKLLAFIKHK